MTQCRVKQSRFQCVRPVLTQDGSKFTQRYSFFSYAKAEPTWKLVLGLKTVV